MPTRFHIWFLIVIVRFVIWLLIRFDIWLLIKCDILLLIKCGIWLLITLAIAHIVETSHVVELINVDSFLPPEFRVVERSPMYRQVHDIDTKVRAFIESCCIYRQEVLVDDIVECKVRSWVVGKNNSGNSLVESLINPPRGDAISEAADNTKIAQAGECLTATSPVSTR